MALKDAWSHDPDMAARDANDLNAHLQITFEETIGEPDHTHSLDCVWKYSYKCFNLWRALCYTILTTICGIPCATCWGCYFACIAFQHIWEITPCLRAYEINMHVLKRCYSIALSAYCDPICMSCSHIFDAFRK